jgi:cell division protein FtsI (penicillin-binding protein 3)
VALTLFTVLGLRLVELQLTDGPAYAATGLSNRLDSVQLPAPRGAIYDRAGAVLAQSLEARFVYADPGMVEDPVRNSEALAPLLGVPAGELVERMRPRLRDDGQPSRFEWLARGVDVDTAEQIEALNLPGIGLQRDEIRQVPGGDLAANLIGFTGSDLVGLAGLEAAFDQTLRGTEGVLTYETGQGHQLAREIPGGYRVETPAQPGSHLRLTVDADLQYEVQRILREFMTPAQATFATAVVLDARTSEVLAQASYPGYDASDPLSAAEEHWRDATTSIVFDPGSAHKPIVLAAALQEGLIGADDTVVVDPTIQKGDVTFRDVGAWHPPGTRMTLPAIMAFSSNVGTIRIADLVGGETLYAYQRAFGLGEPTGVGLPGEASGALLPPEEWYGSSYGSVPIGHSVDITALQLAAAYGVIANDGTWVRPSLVQAVIEPDGSETPVAQPETRQVLSRQTAADLREILEAVVAVPGATGTAGAVDGYRVAGKTGTGRVAVDGDYAEGEVASFVGMAPAEAPRYVVAVVAHTPQGGGGTVAGPAFQEMMGFTLTHYRVPPSTSEPPEFLLYG